MWVDHKPVDDGYIKDLSFSRVYLSRYHNCEDSLKFRLSPQFKYTYFMC